MVWAGCQPATRDTLHEFAIDFARSGLAAWLL
jgi:hypothetical protein